MLPHFEFQCHELKDFKCGMRKFAWLPHDAFGRIGGTMFYSVWFLNCYFSVKWTWLRHWSPRINTPIPDNADTPAIQLRLGVWCSTPVGRHQYMLTWNNGASVWVILPTWMSWQNHYYWIKRKVG